MSMSVKQRRTEVLKELSAPAIGKLRLAKASSKYDRRQRYLVVEWCPPEFVDTDLEEYSYTALANWHPASDKDHRKEAEAVLSGAWYALRAKASRSP